MKISIVLNEKEDEIYERLKDNIEEYLDHNSYNVKIENGNFQELFYS